MSYNSTVNIMSFVIDVDNISSDVTIEIFYFCHLLVLNYVVEVDCQSR